MPPLTLFEHDTQPFAWDDQDLASLERLRRTTGVEVLRATTRRGERRLQAAQYVGAVRLRRQTVQILPKIYQAGAEVSEAERARQATHNLLHLLAEAGQVPIREHEVAPLLRQDRDWFEILTRLFASHLTEEWQRGAHRGYQGVEDDLPVLKGRWRIGEQLRRPARQHVFAVAYDEFTADNPLNRVFRFVVERLWRLTRDADNFRRLGELQQWMEEVTLLPTITVADASPALVSRLNQRYAPLLNLARLFLDGATLQLAADDLTTFAFVFDMNSLFETFVVNLVRRHREVVLPPELRPCDVLAQTAGAVRHLARTEDGPVFKLKPDLALRLDGQFRLLLDAKYKRLNQADRDLGVAQDDFYQMHAYAHRYDCPRILLIYPQTADMPEPLHRRFELHSMPAVIQAATLDVRVDLGRPEGREGLKTELATILRGINLDGPA